MKNRNNSGETGKKYGAAGIDTEKEQKSEINPTAPEQYFFVDEKSTFQFFEQFNYLLRLGLALEFSHRLAEHHIKGKLF